MEFYDASSAEPVKPLDRVLGELSAQGATATLLARLDEVDDLVDRILEEEAAQPLDPEIVQSLDVITGADDAPEHFSRVHDRVRRGLTTWEAFWQRPHDEYRGFEIIQAAIERTTSEAADTMARLDTRERRD